MEPPIRFASYALDPAAGELRKGGVRVPLAGQPLEVLALLASRPGEVVTREELKDALWPDDTFVDFDNGVNSAVRRIRRALDDSATDPKFIETLPKRGYRFIGEVEPIDSLEKDAAEESRRQEDASGAQEERQRGRRRRLLAAAAVVAVLLGGIYWLWGGPTEEAPPVTEPPRNLTALPGIERDPTFSPDGRQFAFAWDEDGQDFDIFVRAVSGGSPVNITEHHSGDDIAPAWSPDGEWIAFWRQDGDQSGVWLASPLGGRERRLSKAYPEIDERVRQAWTSIQLSWSPEGLLAFSTHTLSADDPTKGRVSGGITVLFPDGEEQLVTQGEDYHPDFSPDGRRIAFVRGRYAFTVDPSVGEPSLDGPVGPEARSYSTGLRWLPGGDRLLVATSLTGMTVRSVRGPAVSHSVAAGLTLNPAVSEQARMLAFARRIRNHNIWRIDLEDGVVNESSSPRKIFASTTSETVPRLAWDGSRILFQSLRNKGVVHSYIADMDGKNLLEHPKAIGGELEGFGGSPRWSPDGRWIAFDTNLQLAVNSSNGGTAKLLTSGRGSGGAPSWSQNGRWIYYQVAEYPMRPRERAAIWRMRFENGEAGEPEPVVEEGGPPNVLGDSLYFLRLVPSGASDQLAIWRTSLDGSETATLVAPAAIDSATRCWAVSDSAIFYVDSQEAEASGEWWVKRLEPSTGETTKVVEMHRPPGYINCLDVARDESFLLYVVDDSDEQDLMVIEGFD